MSYGETQELSERLTTRDEPVAICAVACIELADFAKRPVRDQMALMARLNELLAQALAGVAAEDRIVLDAGNGVALVFPRDPGQCLAFASALHTALASETGEVVRLRIGLNVGPLRLLRADNGRPLFVGDGLAVGRQIASFADVGRIVASRAFYEAIAARSGSWARRFRYAGMRADASVREHHLYALREGAAPVRRAVQAVRPWAGAAAGTARGLASAAAGMQAGVMRRPSLATALAVAVIVAGAFILRPSPGETPLVAVADRRAEAAPQRTPDANAQPAPVPPAGPNALSMAETPARPPGPTLPEAAATAPLAGGAAEPASAMTAEADPRMNPASAPTRTPLEPAPAKPAAKAAGQPAANPAVKPVAKPEQPPSTVARSTPTEPRVSDQAVLTGAVRLTVIPWGEIYLDGEKLGVAPPLRDVVLEPGVYRIEIRNPGFASLMQLVEVNAGEQVRIRHKFD